MSKSVLIIDTPADCRDCTVRSLGDDCMAMGRHVKEYRENKCRPQWCPLEEIKESSVKRCIAHWRGMGILPWNFTGSARRIRKRIRNVLALYAWFSKLWEV